MVSFQVRTSGRFADFTGSERRVGWTEGRGRRGGNVQGRKRGKDTTEMKGESMD